MVERGYFFTQGIISVWNSLPQNVMITSLGHFSKGIGHLLQTGLPVAKVMSMYISQVSATVPLKTRCREAVVEENISLLFVGFLETDGVLQKIRNIYCF